LVVFIRRRLQKRRAKRLNNWQGLSSDTYDFNHAPQPDRVMSQRSSFATTYDIAAVHPSSFNLPEIPAIAEIRDNHPTHMQGMDVPTVLIDFDDDGQDVLVQPPPVMVTGNANLYLPPSPTSPTPSRMSVRPFSPSEMFSFPKPPGRNSVSSSAIPKSPAYIHEFGETEIVCRPFVPSLSDELCVKPEDRVRILQVFPDGWALVEKVGNDKGKGKAEAPGLIPMDCFRQAGEDFPAFMVAAQSMSTSGPRLA